ncbi:PREDICTED: membrane metallo-endopeptidase-like 1 [Nicrophorus vespilloides]|uniref:Membrane metallo-endopeptidase-like 1 n=1 Tax=Nicrophorus vespilloides TaxID=110193 RepID=A0ABM1MF60_NICVS|nr:PREDICTED: membrane metallo-endopeptidase-like 1 [Nicrophorus vespilloides]
MSVIILKAAVSAGFLYAFLNSFLNLLEKPEHVHNINFTEINKTATLDDLQPNEFEFFRDNKECTHKDCVITAAEYLANMNQRIDPCEDFYEFACGNYARHNTIPDDKHIINELYKVKHQADSDLKEILEEPISDEDPKHFKYLKKYYKYCMDEGLGEIYFLEKIDERGRTTIQMILDDVGGWPVLGNKNVNNWEDVIYALNEYGFYPEYFFTLSLDTDYVNNTKRSLSISAPKTTIKRDALVKGIGDKNVDNYFTYMKDVVELIGAGPDYKEQLKSSLQLEIALQNATKSPTEIFENITALYNLFTIKQLDENFPGFPWLRYLKAMLPIDLMIDEDTEIILTEPKYAKELIKLLMDTPKTTIINYLLWRAVFDVVPYLDSSVRSSLQTLYYKILGNESKSPRSTECIENLQGLNILVGALYVRKKFDIKSRDTARALTKSIKSTFKTILSRTDWPETERMKAIEKVEAVYEHVGFSDELMNDEILDSAFGKLDQDADDFLLLNLKKMAFQRDFDFRMLNRPVDRSSWLEQRGAAEANAYYKIDRNSIIVPAAILQGNYFNSHFPMYVNYGAIGSVIGHEISHGFDGLGHQFDKAGNLINWWSKEAEQIFQEKKDCIINQYSSYTINGSKINGELTVNENIADFGGAKTSYIGYIRWMRKYGPDMKLPGLNYTDKQMYWLSLANIWCANERPESLKFSLLTDVHAPSKFRVNGPLRNIPMFAADFKCPHGSRMNPIDKCTPW